MYPSPFKGCLKPSWKKKLRPVVYERVYIDDIIFIHIKKEYYSIIKRVLDKLASRNVTVNFEKSFFFHKSVKSLVFHWLSYVIHENKASPIENVVKVVNEIQIPTTKNELQQVSGITQYHSKFIHNISNQAKRMIHELPNKQWWHNRLDWRNDERMRNHQESSQG